MTMDFQVYYEEAGEGFPLVLLHGNGDSCRYFKRQVPHFSRQYRVLTPDTRGHGQSGRGQAPFTLVQFAEDLKEFLDERGITRCHLLGFSDGANIAMLFTLRHPEYVQALVLDGGNQNPAGVKLRYQAPVVLGWLSLSLFALFDKTLASKRDMLGLMTTQPNISREMLGTLELPVLVTAGQDDMIRDRHTRALAAAVPGSCLEILPGDHFHARRRSEDFNRVLEKFLRDHTPAAQGA